MSATRKGIVGAITIPLAFGVVELASGLELARAPQDPSTSSGAAVNRADRAAGTAGPALPMQTVAIRRDELATSFLVRVRIAREARRRPDAPLPKKSEDRKAGCEPVVSIFAEVFTQLQPGRCIT